MRSISSRRSAPSTSGREAAVADARPRARAGRRAPGRPLKSFAGSSVQRVVSSWTMPARCGAQPRHAAELQRVRDLVQRDPAQELVGVRVERAGGVAEVGRDEQQPRGRLRVEHGELVLAEHAAGEEAGDRAGLDRRARRPRRAPTMPPSGPMRAAALRRRGRARRASSAGSRRSRRRGRPPRRRAARPRWASARCTPRRAARPRPPGARAPGTASASPAGCSAATPSATFAASCQSTMAPWMAGALSDSLRRTRASSASPASGRAATTGETRLASSSGAPSGSAQP